MSVLRDGKKNKLNKIEYFTKNKRKPIAIIAPTVREQSQQKRFLAVKRGYKSRPSLLFSTTAVY